MNSIKQMETSPNMHSIKAILDELNYLVYKAKADETKKLEENEDVQFLFHHVYPGKAIPLYEALFGESKYALMRKRYHEEVKCVAGGGGTLAQ